VLLGVGRRLVAGVALIDEGDLDRVARHVLDLLCQSSHLGSILVAGWGD
jgi:hypothetical protein